MPSSALGFNPNSLPHLRAALLGAGRRLHPADRPFKRDRIGTDQRAVSLHHHRVLLPVSARFQIAVHGIQKIVAVELRVEAENAASQQAFQHFVAPGTDAHPLGIGPGNVPEDNDGGGGQALANHRGRQGEVIILHQDDGILRVHFAAHRVGKFLVDGAVLPPVLGAEDGPRVRHVAERPQPFVGKAVVVTLLFFFREPDAPDVIRLFIGRHAHVIVAVHRFAIGAAASVGHPDAGAGAHDWFERGDQAAGRMLDFDSAFCCVLMDVRLAVCQDDDLLSMQVPVQGLLQALRRPQPGSVLPIVGHAPDQLAHIAENGLKLAAVLASAAQQAAQFHAPVGARPLCHQKGHAEGHDGQNAEDHDQEGLRRFLAPFNKAKVVHQNRESKFLSLRQDGHGAHLNAAGGKRRDRAPLVKLRVRIARARHRRCERAPHRQATELVGKSWSARSRASSPHCTPPRPSRARRAPGTPTASEDFPGRSMHPPATAGRRSAPTGRAN